MVQPALLPAEAVAFEDEVEEAAVEDDAAAEEEEAEEEEACRASR